MKSGSRQPASQFLNPASINLKKLPQISVSGFVTTFKEAGLTQAAILSASFYVPDGPCTSSLLLQRLAIEPVSH